jgi:hypothetical protein
VFAPPPGWVRLEPPSGAVAAWGSSTDPAAQKLVLTAVRTSMTADQFDEQDAAKLGASLPGFTLGASQTTSSCGGQLAHYLSYSATAGNGTVVMFERMTTVLGGLAWTATYSRLASQPSTASARTALSSLCGAVIPANPTAAPHHAASAPTPTPAPAPKPQSTPTPQPPSPSSAPFPTSAPYLEAPK